MNVFDEPKIDAHCHVLDPARFPYAPDVAYRPAGQEQGGIDAYLQVMDAYGIRHALIVGPNSGYGTDNRCLLDALARAPGQLKGIAFVALDTSTEQLQQMQAQSVIGVALNATVLGVDHVLRAAPLLQRAGRAEESTHGAGWSRSQFFYALASGRLESAQRYLAAMIEAASEVLADA